MNNLADTQANTSPGLSKVDFNTPALQRQRRIRHLKDQFARWYVTVGGLAVLGAITLIFFYLAQVVLPMFQGASLHPHSELKTPWLNDDKTLLLVMEEQNKVAMQALSTGEVRFFSLESGALIKSQQLPLPEGSQVVSLAEDTPGSRGFVVGLSNGQALVVRHDYKVSYPNNQKTITPSLAFPFGRTPLTINEQGQALTEVSMSLNSEVLLVVASDTQQQLHTLRISRTENLLTGEATLEQERLRLPKLGVEVQTLVLDPRHQWLYAIGQNASAEVLDLRKQRLVGRYKLTDNKATITSVSPLLGGISLLIGDSSGQISQWFMVRNDEGGAQLEQVRRFSLGQAQITQIIPEQRRKGFLALDADGQLGIFHSTAHRTLLTESVGEGSVLAALSPRADRVLVHSAGGFHTLEVDNPHPEISWSALWDKVWYESYPEPDYIWQSTSANSDFEPKLSLSPLAFGTLKAAFYAMLLAAPLAICSAIYTAYFMAPAMRSKVKPVIELMEALPTVILGFFAGLFLAPYAETHLPGIFSLMIMLPLGILGAAYGWTQVPERIRLRVPAGWEAALLIPVILLVSLVALSMSGYLEAWFFGGDMRLWLLNEVGITFDQRNALVVGLAMGFAVIPTIFSIAEDAVFSVPKSLTLGSLALGATPWQTLSRVVILTASPGIFSAVMIGLGRAVGETMIVLMATGNTPIMDMNIFEGMRTLAANIAVEMPESEVGGTHYRVLFLAAFVLLTFTFVMNTLAELIRQRLRGKYSSL